MWSPGYLVHFRTRPRVTGGFAGPAPRAYIPPLVVAGSAMRARTGAGDRPAVATFAVVAAAVVTVVRCLVIIYVVVQVAIWHSFYTAVPWRLAGPAAAVACAAAVVTGLRRGLPARWLALGDVPVHLALALSAAVFLPPLMRGDTANWLYLALLDTLVLPALFTSARLTVALAAAAAAAFWGGDLLSRPAGGSSPLAAGGFLLALAAAMCWGHSALRRRAAAADAALGRADQEARDQYVLRSRSAERREHERLLHDTVLNTLTALAREDTGRAGAIGRCRHDVALMEQALTDADADVARPPAAGTPTAGVPAAGVPVAGVPVAGVPAAGLLTGLTAVAQEMAGRGLEVTVTSGPPAAGAGPVPPEVAAAVTHAVREALANVAQHAGTTRAAVEVSLADGLEVLVRDAGAGFDPERTDPSRLGVRRSIRERLADVGGLASVRSAPGAGTVVSLRWPGAAGPGAAGPGPPSRGRRRRRLMLPGDGLVRDAYEAELPRTVAGVALIWQVTILIQVLAYLGDYRHPVICLLAWTGMLGVAGWLVPRARRAGMRRPDAAVAVAAAVLVVALVGWQRRSGAVGSVDWSVAGTAWLLALVALFRPAWELATGAVAVFAVHAFFSVRVLGLTTLGMARLEATAYTLVVVLAVFAALRPAFAVHARISAWRSALASQAAAQRAAAAAIQQDRRSRLVLLDAEALPLLRGIAEGRLDPAEPGVRDRCARLAATLRRALSDGAARSGELLAGLEPVLAAARARGVPMEVQVIGDPGRPDREVVAATRAAIDAVVRVLPPHPVLLTVLTSEQDVELYLTFERRPVGRLDVPRMRRAELAAARWRAAVDVDETGAGCLEIRWQRVPA